MGTGGATDWRRAAARRFAGALALIVAGLVVAVLTDGIARIVGWGVVALGVTAAVSLFFLEIGLSEDRERAREERARRRPRA